MATQRKRRSRKEKGVKIRDSKIYGSYRDVSVDEGQLETKFKIWVSDWNKRVFKGKLLVPSKPCYFYNAHQWHLIDTLVDLYHQNHVESLGQDRFAWTTFASAIIKGHQKRNTFPYDWRHLGKCQNHRCLYLLLWVSFFLKLPCSELVCEILREVITCTQNLRFMFSFLPGMSLELYQSLLYTNPPLFEEKLCSDYFSLIDADAASGNGKYNDVFKQSQPLLLYVVHHLTPLHQMPSLVSFTLSEMINQPLLPERKYSLMTLAIQYHDKELVQLLVQLGASPQYQYWDSCNQHFTSAERIMIYSINSIIGSQQFLINSDCVIKEVEEYFERVVSTVTMYVPYIRRSVIRSGLRKATNIWASEDSTYELNRQIADKWNIECQEPFPTLQHICRINIRQQIFRADKQLLPQAVDKLPLPGKVKLYLNLSFD